MAPFAKGDLACLSNENFWLPKEKARELALRFAGPIKILGTYDHVAFELDLPAPPRQRGNYTSLLRNPHPKADRRFPGCAADQILSFGERSANWAIAKISAHLVKTNNSKFGVHHQTGDKLWLPYADVIRTERFVVYLDLDEASGISGLR
ncbi:hypothetical protein SISNIDRAFT_416515, partial [Sistotremastrum niveocremeum HHB9708]